MSRTDSSSKTRAVTDSDIDFVCQVQEITGDAVDARLIPRHVRGDLLQRRSADCASKGTLASGIGVGTGTGFASEAEACSPDAIPPLKPKRMINKTTRLTIASSATRGSSPVVPSAGS